MLCRIFSDDPGRGVSLHLFVCHAGRVSCLAHGVESDPGIWCGLCGCRHRLVRLFQQFTELAGLELPYWATNPPHWAGGPEGSIANFPAAIIVLLVTAILVIGIKESARAAGMIVLLKLAVILFFIAVGAPAVNADNWTPFMPHGFEGVRAAAAIIFFAYIGFDAVSTAAEEARNPQRDVPIGILGSLAVCTVLYISVAAVLTGLVPVSQIDIHAPVAEALSLVGFKWGAAIVAIGAVAGITSVLVVMMLGQIRVFFAMSRDQLLGPVAVQGSPDVRDPASCDYFDRTRCCNPGSVCFRSEKRLI